MGSNRVGRWRSGSDGAHKNGQRYQKLAERWPEADPYGLCTIEADLVQVFGTGATAGYNYQTQEISFTAATAVRVNGAFESFCDNYVAYVRYTSSATANIYWRLSANFVDDETGYSYQYLYLDGSTLSGARVSTTASYFAYGSTGSIPSSAVIYFYGPYLAQPTVVASRSMTNITDVGIFDFSTMHNVSSAFDGFLFAPDAGTITGTIAVYGLKE